MNRQASSILHFPCRPRLGVVGMAYGGYNLGEELGPAKLADMRQFLGTQPVTVNAATRFVLTESDARAAGEELARADVDCILAVITTFVPDAFIVALLEACDKPVFLWCVEREMQCISVVCGPLITATLFNLGKRYEIVGADVTPVGVPAFLRSAVALAKAEAGSSPEDRLKAGHQRVDSHGVGVPASAGGATLHRLLSFARAAMLLRILRTLRVGYCGGKCPIMMSMAADEYALKRLLGTTVVPLPVEEFYELAKGVSDGEAQAAWHGIKAGVGEVTALEADGLQSSRYYLAARRLVEKHRLDALSLNCFPHLKSKICLGVAKLNDDGIAAACEGDLHSTILMHALGCLTGRPAFNGDWLRMVPETNEVLFSHCGAGAFSLAGRPKDVCLRCSIETKDGLAVCYATRIRGPVTLANLMMGTDGGLRLAALCGEGVETDLSYEGTPLKVRFADGPDTLLQRIARCGAGHHWNGAEGDWTRELELLCEWSGVRWTKVV
jgi:L-arabinose isomerase